MKLILVLLLAVLIQGCGQSSSSPAEKPFNSLWTNPSNSLDAIDLRGIEFDQTYYFDIPVTETGFCECRVIPQGSISSGYFHIYECAYYGPGPNICAGYDFSARTFTKSKDELIICDANPTCTSYK